jgi:outer membrane protein OmpA-like peptidoglycan-associated protein
MNYKSIFLTATMALFVMSEVTAQEDTRDQLKSYSFAEAQGGIQWTSLDGKWSKLITPTAALSVGHFFTPVIGARVHVNAWEAKSALPDTERYYKWNYITPSVDLMLNLCNLFSSQPRHLLNVMLIGGLGVNYAWNNDVLKATDNSNKNLSRKDNRLSHNARVGLRLETDITKKFGISLEALANNTNDRFISNKTEENFWQFTAMVGVSYRFAKRHKKPAPVIMPVVQEIAEDNSADMAPTVPIVTEKPKKAVMKNDKLQEEIFYVICKSDPTETGNSQLQRVADFMKKYKDARVTVVGYADKGTGTPEVNARYARTRAEECKNALVKIFGCDASRIDIDSKGDTVQPFTENDKNRCVIIDSSAQYEVYE